MTRFLNFYLLPFYFLLPKEALRASIKRAMLVTIARKMKPFTKVRRYIERHAMFTGTRGVVVAVSGGPDSIALLDMLVRWCKAHVAVG